MIKKVLLIDDDLPTNIYHRIILQDSALVEEIVDCLGVDEAMAILKSDQEPPDIIFLDINMPMKTGWDFLEEYSTLDASKRAKRIVMLSTTKMPMDLERANKNFLVSTFFLKPLTIENIEQLNKEIS